MFTTAIYQCCAVHFQRNVSNRATAQTPSHGRADPKGILDHKNADQAQMALMTWIARWSDEPGFNLLISWIEETFSVYRLTQNHPRLMKSTNILDRYNEETRVDPVGCRSFQTKRRIYGRFERWQLNLTTIGPDGSLILTPFLLRLRVWL